MTPHAARTLVRCWLLVLFVAAFLLSALAGTRASALGATPDPSAAATGAALDASPTEAASATAPPPAAALAATPTPLPTPAAAAPPTATTAPPAADSPHRGGGGANQARVVNRRDGQLAVKGSVQLNRIPGPTAGPVNTASASSSCVDCTTIAVALQLNLISRDARRITPQNTAVALNERCSRCRTFAVALQYTYQVDDPKETPAEVVDLMREMDREVQAIGRSKGITLPEAAARLDAVIGRFRTLAASLDDRRSVDDGDGGTPSPDTPVPASPASAPVATPAGTPTPATPMAAPAMLPGEAPTASPPPPTAATTAAAAARAAPAPSSLAAPAVVPPPTLGPLPSPTAPPAAR